MFPTTRWTLVLAAKADPAQRRRAFEQLFRDYWQPLYVFARRRGATESDAADLLQGFLAHLLENETLAKLDPTLGRMRSFLQVAFRNWMANQHEKQVAERRGAGAIPLDLASGEALLVRSEDGDPERAYERAWASVVFERALARLESELGAPGRKGLSFGSIRAFFGPEPPSYDTAAAEAGVTVAALTSFLHRARARFRRILEEDVAETVASPEAAAAELAELARNLG